jgi:hypothetical protein
VTRCLEAAVKESEETVIGWQRRGRHFSILELIEQTDLNGDRCLYQESIQAFVIEPKGKRGKTHSD